MKSGMRTLRSYSMWRSCSAGLLKSAVTERFGGNYRAKPANSKLHIYISLETEPKLQPSTYNEEFLTTTQRHEVKKHVPPLSTEANIFIQIPTT
jgi:hypothetical protein